MMGDEILLSYSNARFPKILVKISELVNVYILSANYNQQIITKDVILRKSALFSDAPTCFVGPSTDYYF